MKTVINLGCGKEVWGSHVILNVTAKRDKVARASDYRKIPGYRVVDITGWWKPFGGTGPVIRAGV
ncbi:hypothetical protein, partial [Bartonella grahamii]|uniref:hypothetical protein n=1 Tax=Bartonella grahamii TaxID=33045 RepID=UPI003CCF11C2